MYRLGAGSRRPLPPPTRTTRGVRFGANYDRDKDLHFVLIDPGLSRLSARQILDRLLGT